MSAVTRLGITVLLAVPELEILAIENEGWRQTLMRSSTGRPEAFATADRSTISSSDRGRTLSSTNQLHVPGGVTVGRRCTKVRQLYSRATADCTEHSDDIKHWLCDSSTVHSTMSIGDPARDFQRGMKDPSHPKHDAWVVLVDPCRVGK